MMFETSKHVPKTEKRCCVFKDNCYLMVFHSLLQLTPYLATLAYSLFERFKFSAKAMLPKEFVFVSQQKYVTLKLVN